MEDIIEETAGLKRQGGRAALASLIWSSGSIPMSEQDKMLVKEDGKVLGTIGGGCLEAEILNVTNTPYGDGNSSMHSGAKLRIGNMHRAGH